MLMEQGLSVVHLFGKSTPNLDREAVIAAVKEAEEADCQVITAAMIGHKSDVAFMALCADWRTLRRLQT
ncbi:MAG: peroxiredoxin, partial [Minisyncoccia bacterium]